jgi:hypothetical protein
MTVRLFQRAWVWFLVACLLQMPLGSAGRERQTSRDFALLQNDCRTQALAAPLATELRDILQRHPLWTQVVLLMSGAGAIGWKAGWKTGLVASFIAGAAVFQNLDAKMNPEEAWQEQFRQAIDRGELHPYSQVTPSSIVARTSEPRRGPSVPGSLAMNASDILKFLPPLPAEAKVQILLNTDEEILINAVYMPMAQMDKWVEYFQLNLKIDGKGTLINPYKVSITGHIKGEAQKNYLRQIGAPPFKPGESPSSLFFTQLIRELQELPWGGLAWSVVSLIDSDS